MTTKGLPLICEPNTHDYTNCSWGHSVEILKVECEGQKLRACGWGNGIKDGDYILLKNEGGATRYQFSKVDYSRGPADMWFADLQFAPRKAPVTPLLDHGKGW